MRRRAFLASLAGGALLGATASTATGHPTASGGTPPDSTPDNADAGPLGHVHVQGATETVVGPDGTTVYVAAMDGFAVVDTSDPAEPTQLASVDGILADHEHGPMEAIQDVKVAGDRLLVVGPAHPRSVVAAAVVYDVSDPAEPSLVDVHETDYPIHNAFLTDEFAYLCANGAEGNPLVVFEVGDGLTERGRWSLFDVDEAWRDVATNLRVIHDVWVQDGRAYVAHWDAGTWIVDVSDPDAPTLVSRVRGRDPESLADVEGSDAVSRESIERPGNDHFVTVNDDATLLGIGVEAWDVDDDGDGGPGPLHLYDVSDPTTPSRVGSIDPPPTPDPSRDGVWTTPHNFELTDGHCYSSWYQGGVRVHDVSDPSDPVERYVWRDPRTTRFWTARRGVPGETFVGSSMGVDTEETAVADAVESGEGTAGTDGEDEPAGAAALYVFPDPVEAGTASTTRGTVAAGAEQTDASGPGFGVLAAVAALGSVGSLAFGVRRFDGEQG